MNDLETAIVCLFSLVLLVEVIPVVACLCVLALTWPRKDKR